MMAVSGAQTARQSTAEQRQVHRNAELLDQLKDRAWLVSLTNVLNQGVIADAAQVNVGGNFPIGQGLVKVLRPGLRHWLEARAGVGRLSPVFVSGFCDFPKKRPIPAY